MKRFLAIAFASATVALGTTTADAGSLVYQPVNPTFGGSPDNGAYLLSTANAVNKHQAPATDSSLTGSSPLSEFNQELEQAILSRLATSITSSIVGTNGTLQPGTISTGQFTVQVQQIGNGQLQVTTTDTTTGQSTTFQVSQ